MRGGSSEEATLFIATTRAFLDKHASLADVRALHARGESYDENARNVISERVLGFPREYAPDRGVAFNQVKHNSFR